MDATLSLGEDLHAAIGQENLCDGVESCRHAVRLQIRRGVDVIKIATTAGVNSRIGAGLGRQKFDDEVKALVDTAHLYGKKMAVHAHGTDGVNAALAAGADSIEHGTMLDDSSIKLFKQSGAYYVPTLSTVNGRVNLAIPSDANATINADTLNGNITNDLGLLGVREAAGVERLGDLLVEVLAVLDLGSPRQHLSHRSSPVSEKFLLGGHNSVEDVDDILVRHSLDLRPDREPCV